MSTGAGGADQAAGRRQELGSAVSTQVRKRGATGCAVVGLGSKAGLPEQLELEQQRGQRGIPAVLKPPQAAQEGLEDPGSRVSFRGRSEERRVGKECRSGWWPWQ